MTDYTKTFAKHGFTTWHSLPEDALSQIIRVLESEISENLVYDHWHPEIAGPLQMAVHFLQTQRTFGTAIKTKLTAGKAREYPL